MWQTQNQSPSMLYGPLMLPGVISECRVRNNPWALLGAAPQTKTKQKSFRNVLCVLWLLTVISDLFLKSHIKDHSLPRVIVTISINPLGKRINRGFANLILNGPCYSTWGCLMVKTSVHPLNPVLSHREAGGQSGLAHPLWRAIRNPDYQDLLCIHEAVGPCGLDYFSRPPHGQNFLPDFLYPKSDETGWGEKKSPTFISL